MNTPSVWKQIGAIFFLCAAVTIPAYAQTFTSLVSFDFNNGAFPYYGGLAQGPDGKFYGTTALAGPGSFGTIFSISSDGSLTTIVGLFEGNGEPLAGLVLATDGNFYGTTNRGGTEAQGTIFRVSTAGVFTSLYSFCTQPFCADGELPYAGLVQGTDGSFYGTTFQGGANQAGTVFKITAAGKLTTLYSFCAKSQLTCVDGKSPQGGMVQATNGDFYGTTTTGGPNNDGTIFHITAAGTLTTLHSFSYMDGVNPQGALIQGVDGNLYGTTVSGGARNDGTIFKMTPAGVLTTICSFCAQNFCADGAAPVAGVIQASDGNFYGTTELGGTTNNGVVYELTSSGSLTLHAFCTQGYPECADGFNPLAPLLQGTDGKFYGTTLNGGTSDAGALFSENDGLNPFVRSLPGSGRVGAEVGILGSDLTGASSVTFNGTAAKFSVQSPTLILTHVPPGATTGIIQVTLPDGTLSSNVPFYVFK